MNPLSKRLKELEDRILPTPSVDWFDVYQAALKKLCHRDRELVAEVMARAADSGKEPHQAAWKRLDKMLIEAAAEMDDAFFLTADEMML